MSERQQLWVTSERARAKCLRWLERMPLGWTVTFQPPRRSDDQNRLMWSLLGEFARRHDWHGQKLTAEEWKDFFTAALKGQRVLPGYAGGFVVIGARTRHMTKNEMSDLIEFMHAFAAERGFEFEGPRALEMAA